MFSMAVADMAGRTLAAVVEFLFAFTLASGKLVLYAAMMAPRDARTRQSALLRALGATRAQLARPRRLEHWLAGAAAGGWLGWRRVLNHPPLLILRPT